MGGPPACAVDAGITPLPVFLPSLPPSSDSSLPSHHLEARHMQASPCLFSSSPPHRQPPFCPPPSQHLEARYVSEEGLRALGVIVPAVTHRTCDRGTGGEATMLSSNPHLAAPYPTLPLFLTARSAHGEAPAIEHAARPVAVLGCLVDQLVKRGENVVSCRAVGGGWGRVGR